MQSTEEQCKRAFIPCVRAILYNIAYDRKSSSFVVTEFYPRTTEDVCLADGSFRRNCALYN